jgi:hypothetical protein
VIFRRLHRSGGASHDADTFNFLPKLTALGSQR